MSLSFHLYVGPGESLIHATLSCWPPSLSAEVTVFQLVHAAEGCGWYCFSCGSQPGIQPREILGTLFCSNRLLSSSPVAGHELILKILARPQNKALVSGIDAVTVIY